MPGGRWEPRLRHPRLRHRRLRHPQSFMALCAVCKSGPARSPASPMPPPTPLRRTMHQNATMASTTTLAPPPGKIPKHISSSISSRRAPRCSTCGSSIAWALLLWRRTTRIGWAGTRWPSTMWRTLPFRMPPRRSRATSKPWRRRQRGRLSTTARQPTSGGCGYASWTRARSTWPRSSSSGPARASRRRRRRHPPGRRPRISRRRCPFHPGSRRHRRCHRLRRPCLLFLRSGWRPTVTATIERSSATCPRRRTLASSNATEAPSSPTRRPPTCPWAPIRTPSCSSSSAASMKA